MANGNVLFAVPNLYLAQVRLDELEAGTGNLLRDEILDAPTDCTATGHVALVQPNALVISCNEGSRLELIVSEP